MFWLFNEVLSRSIQSCQQLVSRTPGLQTPRQILVSLRSLQDESGSIAVEISDEGFPFPQDHKVLRSFARSLFYKDSTPCMIQLEKIKITSRDDRQPRSFEIQKNPRSQQISIQSTDLTVGASSFTSVVSFTLPSVFQESSEGTELKAMLMMLRTLLTRLVLISVPLTFTLRVQGEDLRRSFHKHFSQDALYSSWSSISREFLEEADFVEEQIGFDLSFPDELSIDMETRLRTLLYSFNSESSRLELSESSQEGVGFLDPKILQEAARLHPVNLFWGGRSEDASLSGPLIGIESARSDRIWKAGRLCGLCGIRASSDLSGSSGCRVLLFDQYGLMEKSSEAVLLALEKVRWEIFGMQLKQITKNHSSISSLTDYPLVLDTATTGEMDYFLQVLFLHLWMDGQQEPRVSLPLMGMNGVVKNCVEGALFQMKSSLRIQMRGKVEKKLFVAVDNIADSVSGIIQRSQNTVFQQQILSVLESHSLHNIPEKTKTMMKRVARSAFDRKYHQDGEKCTQRQVLSTGQPSSFNGDPNLIPDAFTDIALRIEPEDWMF